MEWTNWKVEELVTRWLREAHMLSRHKVSNEVTHNTLFGRYNPVLQPCLLAVQPDLTLWRDITKCEFNYYFFLPVLSFQNNEDQRWLCPQIYGGDFWKFIKRQDLTQGHRMSVSATLNLFSIKIIFTHLINTVSLCL